MNQVVQVRRHAPAPLLSLPELLLALATIAEVEPPGALAARRLRKASNSGRTPRRPRPPPAWRRRR